MVVELDVNIWSQAWVPTPGVYEDTFSGAKGSTYLRKVSILVRRLSFFIYLSVVDTYYRRHKKGFVTKTPVQKRPQLCEKVLVTNTYTNFGAFT